MPKIDLTEIEALAELEQLHRKVRSLEGQVARSKIAPKQLLAANAEIVRLEQVVDILTALDGIEATPAEWAQPKKPRSGHRAIANLILSDLHLDEIVDPDQMRGMNAYNREIAAARIGRLGENTVKMARDYIAGVTYDGLYLWINGDIISGDIHEELKKTNAAMAITSTDYWVDPLVSLLLFLADFFKKVHVVVTVGNHPRTTQKPEAKNAVKTNFDWLLSRIIWRELRNDSRFTWNVSLSKDVRETVYSTRYLAQHGDDFKGGDQIAGPMRPILMADFRSTVRETRAPGGEPFDVQVVSHFHQYVPHPRFRLNGSVVGYSEYSKSRNYGWEPPQQAFWLTTPEQGASMDMPIRCSDPVKEGWGK